MFDFTNVTDLTGLYLDSPAEREERDASLAGMFATPDPSYREQWEADMEAAWEAARF